MKKANNLIKRLALMAFLTCISFSASAAVTYSLTYEVNGITDAPYMLMEFDVNDPAPSGNARLMIDAKGVIVADPALNIGAFGAIFDGACYVNPRASGTGPLVKCSMFLEGGGSLRVELFANANGTIEIFDENFDSEETGTLTLLGGE